MRKILLITVSSLFLTGCFSTKEIGKINMISNRNIDSKTEYIVIKNYVGGTKKELKKMKAETIEQAVDNVVRNVPGGEFLKNVKIYIVKGKYYAVEGDVWGYPTNANYKGFKVGDSVQWKDNFKEHKGVITDLKNETECTIREENSGDLKVVKYSELLKSN